MKPSNNLILKLLMKHIRSIPKLAKSFDFSYNKVSGRCLCTFIFIYKNNINLHFKNNIKLNFKIILIHIFKII